jgi:hypothetical protein
VWRSSLPPFCNPFEADRKSKDANKATNNVPIKDSTTSNGNGILKSDGNAPRFADLSRRASLDRQNVMADRRHYAGVGRDKKSPGKAGATRGEVFNGPISDPTPARVKAKRAAEALTAYIR